MLRELEVWEMEEVVGGENVTCIGLPVLRACFDHDTGVVTGSVDLGVASFERVLHYPPTIIVVPNISGDGGYGSGSSGSGASVYW
jgi:hypothetical protein